MEEDAPEKRAPSLRQEPSNLSDYSVDSNSTVVGSPPSPIQHRAGYRRVSSLGGQDLSYMGAGASHQGADDARRSSYARGLGIENVNSAPRASVQRVPVGSKSEPNTPQPSDPLLSPPSAQLGQSFGPTMDHRTQGDPEDFSFAQFSTPSLSQPFSAGSESERLHKKNLSASIRSYEPSGMCIPSIEAVFATCTSSIPLTLRGTLVSKSVIFYYSCSLQPFLP